MKTCLLFCLGVLLTFNGCKKPETDPTPPVAASCGGDKPTEELKWLKDLIQDAIDNQRKYIATGIFKAKWKEKTIFVVYRVTSSAIFEAYNCDGTKIDAKSMSESERLEFYKIQPLRSDLVWEQTL